ncbi:hypothetical protein EV356DRAFT_67463 [Viridothelium virens]|uniref:Uncharacterized protein n=1 Tax=Viridothelium virens TaxID=1048519 RepID=A0A6A6HFQ5_VIRVR|nr:hypothetical protein EV356DRAFT_67463 [Viridothelium virens]
MRESTWRRVGEAVFYLYLSSLLFSFCTKFFFIWPSVSSEDALPHISYCVSLSVSYKRISYARALRQPNSEVFFSTKSLGPALGLPKRRMIWCTSVRRHFVISGMLKYFPFPH